MATTAVTENFENQVLDSWPYVLTKFLGHGAFGQIYIGRDINTGNVVAVKLELTNSPMSQLAFEFMFYSKLKDSLCHPKVYGFGQFRNETYNFLILEMLGPSLKELGTKFGGFSQRCLGALAIKLIDVFKFTHSRGIIHRDVKPENYLFGRRDGENQLQIYMIDLGIAKEFVTKDGEHIPQEDLPVIVGTPPFMSVSMHRRKTVSRRDDLESLWYILLYLHKMRLPWIDEGQRAPNQEAKLEIYLSGKVVPPVRMFEGFSRVFPKILERIKALSFEERPAYEKYIKSLEEYLLKEFEVRSLDAGLDFDERHERRRSATRLKRNSRISKRSTQSRLRNNSRKNARKS